MSQQGPGGYGGGGPYGPPGGGGYGGAPPGGYPPPPPGAPPGGYGGPPGYGPPGAPPHNYGQPQYGAPPPGGSPSPGKSPLIWVGVGCGVLVLLGAAGGVFAFMAARKKANDVEQQFALAASGVAIAASGVALGASAFNGQTPATPACANAIACCKLTIAKTAGANATAVEQACSGLGMLSDAACAQQYEAQKRAATALGLICP